MVALETRSRAIRFVMADDHGLLREFPEVMTWLTTRVSWKTMARLKAGLNVSAFPSRLCELGSLGLRKRRLNWVMAPYSNGAFMQSRTFVACAVWLQGRDLFRKTMCQLSLEGVFEASRTVRHDGVFRHEGRSGRRIQRNGRASVRAAYMAEQGLIIGVRIRADWFEA